MALFQNSVLKKYLAGQEQAAMHAAFGAYLHGLLLKNKVSSN